MGLLVIGKNIVSLEPMSASQTNSSSYYITLSKVESISISESACDQKDKNDVLYSVHAQMVSGSKIPCYFGYDLSGKTEASRVALELANLIEKSSYGNEVVND